MEPLFRVGQIVSLKADSSRTGPVIEVLTSTALQTRYRVFHSSSQIAEYYEDQLISVDQGASPNDLAELILRGDLLDIASFRARLTASRLSHPLTDNIYALQSARIQFIPFQFKPLLRFLRSDRPRLLIADEVGVGKTIEAGLILRELQTRQQVGNILVICPKALVGKWRMEMLRFDEEFRPLSADSLRYCLHEAHLDGAWPQQFSRSIVHLELLRKEDYLAGSGRRRQRPGLLTLDPPPQFSLVIVDEAHHLKNPESQSHELARFLCDVSDAVLFLSATPIQLGSSNLYTLLNLLRPDIFIDENVFEQMVEPNRHLNQAMRHIRNRTPDDGWQTEALNALLSAFTTAWGQQVLLKEPKFITWIAQLQKSQPLSDAERIKCLRDLEEMHTLAHVMNRTRRRDIGRFTIREPQTVYVPFTPEQQLFYDRLLEFRREMLLLDHSPLVVRLIVDTLERQLSSCLPALLPLLNKFIGTGRFSYSQASDYDEEEDTDENLPQYLIQRAKELRELALALPDEDPKLRQLLAIIESTLAGDGPGKVLIFSFFLHTLDYLEDQLRLAGIRVALVKGDTPDEDRAQLRDRFRLPRSDPKALDVLLSSEVGCEGLDYEFCDRLVNYDIPWNPMRIEQRIGRIDRFGQKSEKVLIYNFVTPGTVEERIFFRCFDRIGVFRDTVGDLEDILGDVIQDLNRIAFDTALSPQQAEEKTRQMADNVIRRAEEQRRLEEDGGQLLGLDGAFTEEVDTLVAQGKFVSQDDLCQMIETFLETQELGGKLTLVSDNLLYRLRLNREARAAVLENVRQIGRYDRQTTAFMRWLQGDDPHLVVTFDQEMALEKRDIPFVTPLHPLARLAINHWFSAVGETVSHIILSDNSLPSGRYLFVCNLWEIVAVRPEIRLVSHVWDLDRASLAPEIAALLIGRLGEVESPRTALAIAEDLVNEGCLRLEGASDQARVEALEELRKANDSLIDRKLASLDTYFRNRLQRVQAEIGQATNERIVRMKKSELSRIQRDFEKKKKEFEDRREATIVNQRIAAGILVIQGEVKNAK